MIPFYHCARNVAKKRLRKISGNFWIAGCTDVVMDFARQTSRFPPLRQNLDDVHGIIVAIPCDLTAQARLSKIILSIRL